MHRDIEMSDTPSSQSENKNDNLIHEEILDLSFSKLWLKGYP